MSTAFDRALAHTLLWEGGYSNHPNDRGGPTRFGITQRFARARGYRGDMRQLPLSLASLWYKESIWNRYQFEEVARADTAVAGYLFDMAVNHGRWTRIAQLASRPFAPVRVDGVWGPKTHAAFVTSALQFPAGFLQELRAQRRDYYRELVRRDPSQAAFMKGWLRRAAGASP